MHHRSTFLAFGRAAIERTDASQKHLLAHELPQRSASSAREEFRLVRYQSDELKNVKMEGLLFGNSLLKNSILIRGEPVKKGLTRKINNSKN